MTNDQFIVLCEGIGGIIAQLKRIADQLEARDKGEEERREQAVILAERVAEAEARRKHQQRYAT